MLTRLEARGFKNLLDVDVRFGPFTCIAGANGVGKSNIFDVILLLRELADKSFVEALHRIRGGDQAQGLFAAHGPKRMFLAAEMLIPGEGEDEFGQRAEASKTFVRYELELNLQAGGDDRSRERIRLRREELSYFKKDEAKKRLGFPHSKSWRDSVIKSSRRTTKFISTTSAPEPVVRLHSDRMRSPGKENRGGGAVSGFVAHTLPRTVLSSARNADEHRTAVLVRNEMRNWRLLQLEPSAMRQPDDFQSQDSMTTLGAHIPATLYRIAASQGDEEGQERTLATASNRLADLVEGVRRVRIDRDEARRAFRFMMTDRYGLELPASALSDGTMRFIALTVLQLDTRETGLICLEEPENGIHPERIQAMLDLLYDIAAETDSPIEDNNPMRQVIISTHSPIVAGRIQEGDLLFARTVATRVDGARAPKLKLSWLDGTWRMNETTSPIQKGRVISYLQGGSLPRAAQGRRVTVIDKFRDQLPLPLAPSVKA